MSAPSPDSAPRRMPWVLFGLLFLLIAGAAVGTYFIWFRPKPPPPQPDMEAAMAANNRGVGYMERLKKDEYAKAEKEFEEAIRLAPDWLPPRINLGIALFNQQEAESIARAREVFAEVLKRDPDNKHAHYCLGIIDADAGRIAEAHAHFQAVNNADPNDAHTWFRLGMTHPAGVRSPEARACFEQAVKHNPYLNGALYNLFLALDPDDPRRAKLHAEREALIKAERAVDTEIRYSVMGQYADVIGRDPKAAGEPGVGRMPLFEPREGFKVTLAQGAKWATPADLDATRRAAHARFGATIVLFDYNTDGKPDIFLTSAVVEGGKVRDLLLRNDGNGTFTDVTAAVGLASPRSSIGAAAGDFDNDGHPDLIITGAGEQHLFRNLPGQKFEDISAAVGLDKVKGVCLGCGWLDLDQDGDLDLVICQYTNGDTSTFAAPAGGGVIVFENIGVAQLTQPKAPAPGLTPVFQRSDKFAAIPAQGSVSFVASDLDSDRDVDLVILQDAAEPVVLENERLMRFKRETPAWAKAQAHKWNGGLVLDANHDERSDLFLIRAGAVPVYLLSQGERDFTGGHTNSPTLKQAVTADIDMDGWPDVVGLGDDGKPVLLHNRGAGRLEAVPDAFGPVPAAQGLMVADLTSDGMPDLLTYSDDGLRLFRSLGNGNAAVLINPTGKREVDPPARTHNDAIGTWIVVQVGSLWTGAERTTVSAGLGQSLLPTALGIGKNDRADVLRLRWPDAVVQAELGIPARTVYRVVETNRKTTSCPILMVWNGERFVYVTDFLGGGAMGETGPDGSVRPPRADESVKIEPGLLAPKDGQFVIKVGEPMDEVLYLDHLRLAVIDHPADTHVFPDERFVLAPPDPSQKLLAFRTRHFPKTATDHKDRDVTQLVLDRDRRAVDAFAVRSWLGYAEDHSLTLDFGDLPAGGKWQLVLAGWTEYPFPDAMYAATRAGIALNPPVLEQPDASGEWKPLCDLGFPAGLPRVMTRELPADFRGGKLRISTNMQVYWDQIYLAQALDVEQVGKVTTLDVSRADLAHRGFAQEIYPDGRPPIAYDDAKTEPVAVTKWKGKLTRLGDVTDLLRAADDRFVLCGPGDEITVRFDAKGLPPLPEGWQRSFVLRTRGYCKDTSITTVSGGTVEPLPFAAMPNYPHFGTAKPPATDAAKWHTRPAGGR